MDNEEILTARLINEFIAVNKLCEGNQILHVLSNFIKKWTYRCAIGVKPVWVTPIG